jgi:hypothetical protein
MLSYKTSSLNTFLFDLVFAEIESFCLLLAKKLTAVVVTKQYFMNLTHMTCLLNFLIFLLIYINSFLLQCSGVTILLLYNKPDRMTGTILAFCLLICLVNLSLQVWPDRWLIAGVKTNNVNTDASAGNKFVTIFYHGNSKLVRTDSVSAQDGKISSTSALFDENLFYINLFSVRFDPIIS